MVSSTLETTRSRKEPCLESREDGELLEFHVWPRKFGSSGMNVRGRCRDAVASFSLSTCQVFCAELRHEVAGEHLDSTPLSLFALPVRIRDAQFHGYQKTQSASP